MDGGRMAAVMVACVRQLSVYGIHYDGGQIVYIGQTCKPVIHRLKQHIGLAKNNGESLLSKWIMRQSDISKIGITTILQTIEHSDRTRWIADKAIDAAERAAIRRHCQLAMSAGAEWLNVKDTPRQDEIYERFRRPRKIKLIDRCNSVGSTNT